MANALILTSPKTMSAPLPDTPRLRLSGDVFVLASDSFSGTSSTMATRKTDSALGGSARSWLSTNPTSVTVSGGRLAARTGVAGTFVTYVELPGPAARLMESSIRVVTPPATGKTIYLDMFRTINGSGSRTCRLVITADTVAVQMVAPTATLLPGSTVRYEAGDRVAYRCNTATGEVGVKVGDAVWQEITAGIDAPLDGSIFGIAGADESGIVLDDWKVTETVL